MRNLFYTGVSRLIPNTSRRKNVVSVSIRRRIDVHRCRYNAGLLGQIISASVPCKMYFTGAKSTLYILLLLNHEHCLARNEASIVTEVLASSGS